jgi:hypothetical protein
MRCRKIDPAEESGVMVKAFIGLLLVQTIAIFAICGVLVSRLIKADLNWFLPYDLLTLVIAVVILSLIIFATGLASATSNTLFAWILFHVFLGVLLLVELITSWIASDTEGFLTAAHQTWLTAAVDDITEFQLDMQCCGFNNETDRPPGTACPDDTEDVSCHSVLWDAILLMRDIASVSMFVDFVFALFIDFAGCGICFHPDIVTLEDVHRETQMQESLSLVEFGSAQSRSGTAFAGAPMGVL